MQSDALAKAKFCSLPYLPLHQMSLSFRGFSRRRPAPCRREKDEILLPVTLPAGAEVARCTPKKLGKLREAIPETFPDRCSRDCRACVDFGVNIACPELLAGRACEGFGVNIACPELLAVALKYLVRRGVLHCSVGLLTLASKVSASAGVPSTSCKEGIKSNNCLR